MRTVDEIREMQKDLRTVWSRHCPIPKEQFQYWVEKTYGIRLVPSRDQKQLLDWVVIDEQKYLIFLLETK